MPNDFGTFFARHPRLQRVYFNGSTAEQCYRRRVLPQLPAGPLVYARLPSTSPAHAALSYEEKFAAWRVVVSAAGGGWGPASRERRR